MSTRPKHCLMSAAGGPALNGGALVSDDAVGLGVEPVRAVSVPSYPALTSGRPLDDVRILDLTSTVAGPVATTLLANLGADVIRIEPPWGRPRNPALAAPGKAGIPDEPWNRVPLYNELLQGKRSLALDLNRPQGRAVVLDLVKRCDVLMENFSPRVMANFNLEWEVLHAINPRLLFVSMPAFGKSGPYRDRIAYGPGIDAMSGLAYLTGYEDGPPLKPGNFYCDLNAGLTAALAVLAGLRAIEAGGEGEAIEVAMLDGELQLVADALLSVQMTGREPSRAGNAHRAWAPHDVYRTAGADEWIAIACRGDGDWAALIRVMRQDAPGVARVLERDRRFASGLRRWKNRGSLNTMLGNWTALQDGSALVVRLQEAGLPASTVMGPAELLADPQVLHRQAAGTLEHSQLGPSLTPGAAFRLHGTPVLPRKAAPLFAEDNDYVLRSLLGYDQQRIDQLVAEDVISYQLLESPPGGR